MRTLGLIGGTSWHSTIEYYRQLNEKVGAIIGTQGNPPMIIHSINIELMRSQNKPAINAKYLEVALKLEQAGAEAIIICANTPHMTYRHVQPKIRIPILHIADATGKEAKQKGLKKLALFGNRPTMTGDFITEVLLNNHQIKTIVPEEEVIAQSHFYVSKELTQGVFSKKAKTFYLHQIANMKKKGADGVILGCTELPLLIDPAEAALPTLPTTDLHVQMAVDFILEASEK